MTWLMMGLAMLAIGMWCLVRASADADKGISALRTDVERLKQQLKDQPK